jgi:hypothetical protein
MKEQMIGDKRWKQTGESNLPDGTEVDLMSSNANFR